ncbi:MAG: dependent oxidoreductase [Paenibacillus sp.]|jgi:hypothetical protein|nr:dependent oxidoreductase [Paenibacillus sp.]
MKKEYSAHIVIVGGSTGGCAAALAAARMGRNVIVTEETDWLGGQLTSQAVPPDEHSYIEQFGCTRGYRRFRDGVRAYYRHHFPLTARARADNRLNPGNAFVSAISHDPRVGVAVLQEMLAPYVHSGQIRVLMHYRIVSAETEGDRVLAVTMEHIRSGEQAILSAPYFLDATDCGDMLPLAGVEYVTGAESSRDTGEPHALQGDPDPTEMQAITYCFAMDHKEGEDHTIDRPRDYSFWREHRPDFWPDKQLSWIAPNPRTLEAQQYTLFPQRDLFSLFLYRRLIDKNNFATGAFDSDISLVNWPQNDYWLGPVIDVSEEQKHANLDAAKQLSLSLLYWMQTEAPRHDGKTGYPGLRLRKDVAGTEDGLAMAPYIRESRRIRAEFTVIENHLNPQLRKDGRSESYVDSVGIGHYAIDLHPSTGNRTFIDVPSLPFQIPLGCLIPVRMNNVIPACKNIGVTHITNGCYRLHPVEWNIGEAAGYLSAFCLDKGYSPRQVRNDREKLEQFQQMLAREGVEMQWPTSVK